MKIAFVGAGSRSFGPEVVRDIFLSDTLAQAGVQLSLMDIKTDNLREIHEYANHLNKRLGRSVSVTSTDNLTAALEGADFVISSIEASRYLYWAQDFHIARRYGFRQIFGENGGPASLFHALRNMGPMIQIARAMEQGCPNALLFNFTNPEHKICEAVSRLTAIRTVGLCHGILSGIKQLSMILDLPVEQLDTAACGMNHFTWFQRIRNRETGEDLYPRLVEAERKGDWLSQWDTLALSRVMFRRFGLWPSPGTNHIGEYVRWSEEFWVPQMQYFYDPADGHPWEGAPVPEFVYGITDHFTPEPWPRPWRYQPTPRLPMQQQDVRPSREVVVPIIEGLALDANHSIPAVNVPNDDFIPNLPYHAVVEVPATVAGGELRPVRMPPLPEAIAAMIRVHLTIHELLVQAFAEKSKAMLLQALLLDPTVHSYRNAVDFVDEMLKLQKEFLPDFC